MSLVLAVLLSGIIPPDSTPALQAVKTCDRTEIRKMISAEPHRRTEFAAAAYAEQRAIATERTALLSGPTSSSPSGQATAATAMASVDARQRQLDDAKATEKLWRDLFDEMRADFLANCNGNRLEH
ncbi:hypothetical protein Y88_2506 [Novosphingobium nitrogenifigens DSM 19370]|uniref:Uncharacterized protein n=1 Tax=Novosphingobium nitrogenifigens DSM 19370 TaxID=983920 RepID=F1Z6R2_9SPHN|nr:hypothetical protein [Novosphingobium nitrogenifigens]EGD59722.1 hypothetical protein Y88_2506 [Novosphingobium nitrogenifigens DSM 19370]